MHQGWSLALKAALLIGLCWYALSHLDLQALGRSFERYSLPGTIGLALWISSCFVLLATRLWVLCARRVPWAVCLKTSLAGFFLNNVSPAALGEMGKVFYLKRSRTASGLEGLEVVFWERFADVNLFLVLLLGAIAQSGINRITLLPAIGVVLVWVFLLMHWIRPAVAHKALSLVPYAPARRFLASLLDKLSTRGRPAFLLLLLALSLPIWLHQFLELLGLVYAVGGLSLSLAESYVVFVMSIAGLAMTLAPGGMGTMEAALVFSLGLCGIEAEAALALALIWRTVLLSLALMAGFWLSLCPTGSAGKVSPESVPAMRSEADTGERSTVPCSSTRVGDGCHHGRVPSRNNRNRPELPEADDGMPPRIRSKQR